MTNQDVTPISGVDSTRVNVNETLDGLILASMFESAGGWMEQHVANINELNVFPVPDGDTGTNMMLTVQSGLKELAKHPSDHDSASKVANHFACGALLGARGNSGVILSQILRGLADGLTDRDVIRAADIVQAMRLATSKAYESVTNPVEGTMLTVIREIRDATEQAYESGERNLLELFVVIEEAAKQAELKTPDLLPVLKEAGVTDSGGHGLWVFFDGALRYLQGEKIALSSDMQTMMDVMGHPQADPAAGDGPWGYDIQYLIKATPEKPLDVMAIREYISSIGDSALVVGDEQLVKVHVHCFNPGPAITYGADQGRLADVVVEDMDEQAEQFFKSEKSASTSETNLQSITPPFMMNNAASIKTTDEVAGIGMVVVAPGEGFERVFRSLGVGQVINGGQTMNPSTQDLLDAVEASPADKVILLPNNKNIILSAGQIPDLTSKDVYLLSTRTIPQGISAVMAFNYNMSDIEENLMLMEDAISAVQTGEVTTSIRTTTIDGVSVHEGNFIGLLNDKLMVAEQTAEAVVRYLFEKLDLDEYEIITFYYGHTITKKDAQNMVESLTADYANLDMEIIEGGQPHYHYIFSVE